MMVPGLTRKEDKMSNLTEGIGRVQAKEPR
jgi:hypothetical protein